MDPRTEPIRQDIDNIRESMTDKMGQIEAKIKDTVEDTTETLKRGLDVKYQVGQHPWAAVGVALLAGYALGSMGESSDSHSRPETYRYRSDYRHNDFRPGEPMRYYGGNGDSSNWRSHQGGSDWHAGQSNGEQSSSSSYNSPSSFSGSNTSSSPSAYNPGYSSYSSGQSYQGGQHQSSERGFFDQVMGQLGIELDTFKTAAISSLVGLVRDTMKQNLPGVYQEAERLREGAQSHSGQSSQGASDRPSPSYSSQSQMPSPTMSGSASGGYGSTSSYGAQSGTAATSYGSPATSSSGEGEFYREADITEGSTTRHQRTPEIYPAGSSLADSSSTQREVGRNPNYDMTPPSPEGTPGGRP